MPSQSSIPPRPSGSSHEARFAQWVWDKLARLNFTTGGNTRVDQTTTGITITAKPAQTDGALIYVKACLADGTECYLPIRIYGPILRTNELETIAPTITEADVPVGALVLE
jgi:hypothetical protein